MLRNLNIRNYALIEKIELEFGPGLTIITGETGAGKSILLGALSLVMGGRADTKVIADGNSKSVVEAVFTDVDEELKPFLEEKGVDWFYDDNGVSELTIRRELSVTGRSKVYLNDTSVTLQTLAQIGPRLIDIHSQHANTKINDASERLRIIDSMAANETLRHNYRKVFSEYVALRRRIKSLHDAMAAARENSEFLRFQLRQLDKLKPKKGELKEIESRFEILSDADEIRGKLSELSSILGDSERGVQSLLAEAGALASKIDFQLLGRSQGVGSEPDTEETIESRLSRNLVEIKDICETIDRYSSLVESNPALMERLSNRMNIYYETLKHFRVRTDEELVDIQDEISMKLSGLTGEGEDMKELEAKARAVASQLKIKAEQLTATRRECAADFSRQIRDKGRTLGLPNLEFQVEVLPAKMSIAGKDEVDFMASFNKNVTPRPISEIASGGEISRMMLSLKAILAGHMNLPTIIFDEVDTGVSGEIADKMGEMMREVGQNMQVIVITHLPQVAAKGAIHYKVFKKDVGNKTVTFVRPLSAEERIEELASMISGSEVTRAALSAATDLLKASDKK